MMMLKMILKRDLKSVRILVKRNFLIFFEGYKDDIPRYIKSQPDNKYRKDPSTFLNKRAWEDEIIGEIKIVEKGCQTMLFFFQETEISIWRSKRIKGRSRQSKKNGSVFYERKRRTTQKLHILSKKQYLL